MNIYRVRKTYGIKGGANYIAHADVYADTPEEALEAAQDNRVYNWRSIDKFDTADEYYTDYEVMDEVIPEDEAKKPGFPLSKYFVPPKDRQGIFMELAK